MSQEGPEIFEAIFGESVAGNFHWLDPRSILVIPDPHSGQLIDGAETVQTTIVANSPDPFGERRAFLPAAYLCVRLIVQVVAKQVYLLIGDEEGTATAFHQMEEGEPDNWELHLRLESGTHHYRYYGDDGLTIERAAPDVAEDVPIRMSRFASFTFSSMCPGMGDAMADYRT